MLIWGQTKKMIDISKKEGKYLLFVKQKPPLKNLELEFDEWDKLHFWLLKEGDDIFKDVNPKKANELFVGDIHDRKINQSNQALP